MNFGEGDGGGAVVGKMVGDGLGFCRMKPLVIVSGNRCGHRGYSFMVRVVISLSQKTPSFWARNLTEFWSSPDRLCDSF